MKYTIVTTDKEELDVLREIEEWQAIEVQASAIREGDLLDAEFGVHQYRVVTISRGTKYATLQVEPASEDSALEPHETRYSLGQLVEVGRLTSSGQAREARKV